MYNSANEEIQVSLLLQYLPLTPVLLETNAILYGTVALPSWQSSMLNANLLIYLLRLSAIITVDHQC